VEQEAQPVMAQEMIAADYLAQAGSDMTIAMVVLFVAGLAMAGAGRLWRMGKLGKNPLLAGRASLLEPLGFCWLLMGLGGLLDRLGVPRALVVPLWFIGFALAAWGLVLGMVSPDWYKPRWMVRDERAAGLEAWPRWNRFWLWATAIVGVAVLLFAVLMAVVAVA
jgi:hypothetical protein